MPDNHAQATARVAPSQAESRSLRIKTGHLVVVEGPDRGRRFAFRPPGARIGKSKDNDIVLSDDTVSKYHLAIEETSEGFLLRDLKSTNGTFLDQNRIREAYLSPGATIRLGATSLRFEPPGDRVQILPSEHDSFEGLTGQSLKMRQIFGILGRVGPTDATVLLVGETGTGKEVVARAIHRSSPRSSKPFSVLDCAAMARDLIESALFGHREGAFTGAVASRRGAFVSAEGGTLFIDEIGELPLDLQPKLLRALEMREVVPLGADQPQKVNVRVVAATHRDLKTMAREGTFRQDLYYRLSVIELQLPPLRERAEDVPALVERFVDQLGHPGRQVAEEALQALMSHRWEGNVRELRNVIERALLFAGDGPVEACHLTLCAPEEPTLPAQEAMLAGDKRLEDVEVQVLLATLKKTGWNKSQAARVLGISRRALLDKIARHNLEP
ncbi:MAG: sigma 54-interacting transcriptional regulator [Candidatus Riflebacteria bacterium]|nr:sigma 54-interacting transcriptional regulator [Candidatus Riflebacteria bacterium]